MRDFLAFLYSSTHRPAFAELCFAPRDPKQGVFHYGWYEWPQEEEALLADARQAAELFGDIYVGASLYDARKRSKDHALPSDIIFLDDAPERDDYAAVVRTSVASIHAYYRTVEALPVERREAIAGRLARELGADPSGSDQGTQLVRLPGGFNTKGGGRFPVTLEKLEPDHFADVGKMVPPVRTSQTFTRVQEAAPDATLDVGPLLGPDGLPRRIREGTQTWKVLTGLWTPEREGKPDTSLARAIVARGLIMHGYPDDEAYALLVHLTTGSSPHKSAEWVRQDCARLVQKYRAKHPEITPTPTRNNAEPYSRNQPELETADDRIAELRKILEWRSHDDVTGRFEYSPAELGEALRVDRRTVQRYLASLEAEGLIEREQLPGPGGGGVMALTPKWWGDADTESLPDGNFQEEGNTSRSHQILPVRTPDTRLERRHEETHDARRATASGPIRAPV